MKRNFNTTQKLNKSDSGYQSNELIKPFNNSFDFSPERSLPKKRKILTCINNSTTNLDLLKVKDVDWNGFMLTVTGEEILDDGTKIVEGVIVENQKSIKIHLEEDWKNTPIMIDHQIFVLKPLKINDTTFVVKNLNGIIIVEPYLLIAPTTIASFHKCERKAVLRERCAEENQISLPLVIGNAVHELFQWVVRNMDKKSITNIKFLEAIFRSKIIPKYITDLALLNIDVRKFVEHVQEYIETIRKWVLTYMPKPHGNGEVFIEDDNSKISDVVDIEENIWLPNIGLKGKIDVTLKLKDLHGNIKYSGLELKTGKSSGNIEHLTQVNLYSLMLSVLDKQDFTPIQLLYLKDGTKSIVKPNNFVIGSMIRMRNELSKYLNIYDDLIAPDLQSEPSICSYCTMNMFCSLERISEKKKGIVTKHYKTGEFLKECTSAGKENGPSSLYKLTAEERSQNGTCLPGLLLTGIEKGDKLKLTFSISLLPPDFRKKWIVGEFVYISSTKRIAICNGVIVSNDSELIVEALTPLSRYLNVNDFYHLDIIEYMRHFQMNINSIVKLMENNDSSNYLRSIVIREVYPISQRLSPSLLKIILPFINNLSEPQRDAVIHSIKTTGYSLIKGMPGAGKTTVIASLVRSLIALGKTVLLASYTNSAVDNCLEKLGKYISDDKILRIGTDSRAQEWSKKYCLKEKIKGIETNDGKIEAVRKIYSTCNIVAGTCISIQEHPIFNNHPKFDVCIVDEASLCLECTVIKSLLNSNTFVLVGDERQLTPLVRNKEAAERGMSISLFEKLSKNKKGLYVINTQFRMNKVLCHIPSTLFYDGEMQCANNNVENAVIKCKDWNSIETKSNFGLPNNICEKILSKKLTDSLIFIDTGTCMYNETTKKDQNGIEVKNKTSNLTESKIAISCLKLLLEFGVSSLDIAIITPFRDQMNTLRTLINQLISKNVNDNEYSNVEISTIDQFQGRDKKVVIFSTVYNYSEDNENCELLNNPRRMNVALTRAKHKLIIIGCINSLRKLELPSKIIGMIDNILLLNE
ncbi:DNA replication ATP-dependent helicase/nuclease DNA2 [Strongyloides ratti]|uniref:DNA replication ATP-dependent helicase/nuclease n=1 Tax=Strongyloides ratti TaxID=34506 RepID=A0A090LDS3_STRRB|nr:DNA replication ATP-dependent helicase/nuclease DNA2 [Strongyloides ratti]CEF66273.1 DNA replication ATP-dependent helicase/nuclease DNA2 [Strongyloides ratti]